MQQGDTVATKAELRRLRAAFPDWRPPSDLTELQAPRASASADEGAIWRLIEQRDYAAARREIDANRQAVAGWTPPAEMLRVLETNEAQAAFDAATASRNAAEAIAIARRSPQIMSCERINNAWLLSDMYVLAGQKGAAVTTYRNTVRSCTKYSQMQPTLEKASAVASAAELSDIFDAARSANRAEAERLNALEKRLSGGGAATPRAATAERTTAQQTEAAPRPQPVATPAPTPSRLPVRGDSRLTEVRSLKEREQYARCIAASTSPQSLDVLYESGRGACIAMIARQRRLSGFAPLHPPGTRSVPMWGAMRNTGWPCPT